MATVHHPVEDDAASVSSVPESHYQGDSDSDDEMDSMLTAQPPAAPPMSAKAREAQAETIRARQIARQHRNNAGTSTQQVDDDIPPPPYSEALGPAEPARASVTLPPVTSEDVDIEAQNHVNEHSPVLETTQPFPHYGTAGHRTHGNAEEAGYGRGRRYTDVSDDTSDPSADELEQRRQQRKAGKQRGRFCGVWRRRKRDDDPRWLSTEARDKRRRSRMKKLIICILLLAPLAFILDQLLSSLIDHSDHRRKGSPGGSNPSQPNPNDPSHPPDDGQPPDEGKPPYDGGHLVNRATTCPKAEWNAFTTVTYNPEADFIFIEAVKYSGDLRGTVRVVKAPSSQQEYIAASVSYANNPEYDLSGTGLYRDEDGLILATPKLEGAGSWYEWSCLDVDVVLSIRNDTPLNTFAIASNHFSIAISPDLFAANPDDEGLHVKGDATLRTLSGRISVPYLSAEHTEIGTASGSIHGKFELHHRLSIDSISGSVNVEIDPKPAPKDDAAQPAELTIKTRSGSIKAHMPTNGKIPNRIYRTTVSSSSSSVSGEYIFGDKGSFTSNSGSIRAELLPYIFSSPASHKSMREGPEVIAKSNCSDYNRSPLDLFTLTASSSTHLNVLDPYDPFTDSCDMPSFKSIHSSSSGSLNIDYPKSWTGKISAETVAGSIDVRGDNLELLSRSWSWLLTWGKTKGIWKRHDSKGNVGLGDVSLDTISSSIRLRFAS